MNKASQNNVCVDVTEIESCFPILSSLRDLAHRNRPLKEGRQFEKLVSAVHRLQMTRIDYCTFRVDSLHVSPHHAYLRKALQAHHLHFQLPWLPRIIRV